MCLNDVMACDEENREFLNDTLNGHNGYLYSTAITRALAMECVRLLMLHF